MWTDNPVRDAAAHDAECERWLMRRPVCDKCGNHIQDDHFFRLDREIVCPDCIDDWLKDYREEIYD